LLAHDALHVGLLVPGLDHEQVFVAADLAVLADRDDDLLEARFVAALADPPESGSDW
jgi:hypothetical protein